MGTTRVRLTLELEINGDVAAGVCTYFIERFGNYSGEDLETPVEDQVEQVILDVLEPHSQELAGNWQINASRSAAISETTEPSLGATDHAIPGLIRRTGLRPRP